MVSHYRATEAHRQNYLALKLLEKQRKN